MTKMSNDTHIRRHPHHIRGPSHLCSGIRALWDTAGEEGWEMTPRSTAMCRPLILFLLRFFLHKKDDATRNPDGPRETSLKKPNAAFPNTLETIKPLLLCVQLCLFCFTLYVSFHYLEHMCAPPPGPHRRSTPAYPRQADLRSSGPQSHHGGSHCSRAGRLSRRKEPLHSSCRPAPLRPGPTRGLDSRIHLRRQGRMKETLNMRKGHNSSRKPGGEVGTGLELTGFQVDVVVSTAAVVRLQWEQCSTAAHWSRGVSPAQVEALAAVVSRPLPVDAPITADLQDRLLTS